MTDLTPTPKQLQYWIDKICYPHEQGVGPSLKDKELASLAFKAGADQQLEACVKWVSEYCPYFGDYPLPEDKLRAARRPKPPTDKELALAELDRLIALIPTEGAMAMAEPIRKVLEALPND
jgi:hypothetical protein